MKFCPEHPLVRRVLASHLVSSSPNPVAPLASSSTTTNLVGPSANHAVVPANLDPRPPSPVSDNNAHESESEREAEPLLLSQVLCTSELRKNLTFEDGLSELCAWEDEIWAQRFDRAQFSPDSQEYREFTKKATYIEAHHMYKKWQRRLSMAQGTEGPDNENATAGPVSANTQAIKKRNGKESSEGRKRRYRAYQESDGIAGPHDWARPGQWPKRNRA